MAKEYAKAFYLSKAWRSTRKAFISYRQSIDGGMCQSCGNVTGYIVDHKKELNPNNINDPEYSLSWTNLQYLCHNCHNKKHMGWQANYKINEQGEIVPHPPIKKCDDY